MGATTTQRPSKHTSDQYYSIVSNLPQTSTDPAKEIELSQIV